MEQRPKHKPVAAVVRVEIKFGAQQQSKRDQRSWLGAWAQTAQRKGGDLRTLSTLCSALTVRAL